MAARSGLRLLKARLEIYYYDPARHLPFDHLNPPLSPKFSLSQLDSQIKDFVGNFLPPNCITFPNVATEQAMADYTSLKVPDLKKLLSERKLSLTGNKPELIKRLQDADAAIPDNAAPDADAAAAVNPPANGTPDDEINYEEEEVAAAPPVAKQTATADAPAAPEATPAGEPASAPEAEANTAAPAAEDAATTAAEPQEVAEAEAAAAPAEPAFSQHLAETNPDDEAAKRAARAKRFGLPEESEEVKKAKRAAKFGIDKSALASTLDAALPERAAKKRGRSGEEGTDKDGSPAPKKNAANGGGGRDDSRGPGRDGGGRRNGQRGGRNAADRGGRGGRGGRNENQRPRQDGPRKEKPATAAVDAAEQAKREARAKKFATQG